MPEFEVEVEPLKPTFETTEAGETQPPSYSEAIAAMYQSAMDGETVTTGEIASGLYPLKKAELNVRVSDRKRTLADRIINSGQPKEKIRSDLETIAMSSSFGESFAPDIAVMLENSDLAISERVKLEKLVAADRILNRFQEQRSQTFGSGVGYFLDYAVSSGVENVLGAGGELLGIETESVEGAGQLIELAQEAATLMDADVSPEFFEAQFTSILERVSDSGMLSDDNPFYLNTFMELVRERGVGETASSERMWQGVDIFASAISPTTIASIKGIGRIANVPSAISKFKSSDEAADFVVASYDTSPSSPVVAEAMRVASVKPASADSAYFFGPEYKALRKSEAAEDAVEAVNKFNFGSRVAPEVFNKAKEDMTKTIRERIDFDKRHEINFEIVPMFDNLIARMYVGKAGGGAGKPFVDKANAEKMAKRIGDGKVVGPFLHEGKDAWAVVKEYNIPSAGLADPTNIKEVNTHLLSAHMSTTARTTALLDAILKQGEAQGSKVLKEQARNFLKVRSKVSKLEEANVSRIFKDLRDVPEESWRVDPLSVEDFKKMYHKQFEELPRQEAIDFFLETQKLNDIDYILTADAILKEAVDNGEEMVKVGADQWERSKKAPDTLDPETPVWVEAEERLVPYKDLNPETVRVLNTLDFSPTGEGAVKYVSSGTLRRLYHTDVLNYNIGGHRKYVEDPKFVVKQPRDVKMADGSAVKGNGSTFMGVRLIEEARVAVAQWNTIADAVRRGASPSDLSKIIKENNDWNVNLETIDDLTEFADEHNLDITADINMGPVNEPLIDQTAGLKTQGDYFVSKTANRGRRDKPLMGFGGVDLDTVTPTRAVVEGFAGSVSRHSTQNYLFNAINGWMKAAEKHIVNLEEVQEMSLREGMNKAVLRKDEAHDALNQERRTIEFALSPTPKDVRALQARIEKYADFVYGKDYKKLASFADAIAKNDPVGFLRAVAFHSKLGLFAVDQVFVQASQLVNVLGVTQASLGVVGSMRVLSGTTPLRAALIKGIPEGALDRIAKNQAPLTGISAEEFVKIRDWVLATGRNVVDRTTVEYNENAGFVSPSRLKSAGKKVLDWGQFGFNEGEQLARLGSVLAAYAERKTAHGIEDIFDDGVTRALLHRSDVLTASMTSKSSAPWQRGALGLPLQFTTYLMRMTEQLTTDILTPKEKVRLGITHLFVWGTASVPFLGSAQDKALYEGNIDPNGELFQAIRFGAIDYALSNLTGSETAVSSRLALGEGVYDLFRKFGEDRFVEVAIGPGGTVFLETFKGTNSLISNLFDTGNLDVAKLDLNRIASQISTMSKAQQAWYIRKYGQMYSKNTGSATSSDSLNNMDALMKLLGIPLKEQQTIWSSVESMSDHSKQLDSAAKNINRVLSAANRAFEDDDMDKYTGLMDTVGELMRPLDVWEREKVLDYLKLNNGQNIVDGVVRQLVRRGRIENANVLEGLTK